jgi:hypothetical protein
MVTKRIFIVLIGLAGGSPAFASSVIELITTEYSQGTPVVGTVEISTRNGNSRVEITSVSSSESGGMIYKPALKEMTAIDHGSQEYYVIDQAMMDRMAGQVSDAMKQMQAALEAMPPEQRALAEQMMQGRMPQQEVAPAPAVTLNKTGEAGTIAGFDCDYYDVMKEGLRIRELCVTGWDNIEEGKEVAAAMMDLAGFFESMRQAFSGSGGLQVMDRQQELFGYMKELNGYPILTRDFAADGSVEMESRIRTAGHVDLAPEFFEPPSTYTQQSLQ